MSYNKRYYFILAILLVYAVAIWIQAFDSLVTHGDKYRARVDKLRMAVDNIDPVRGFIFADGGELLAGSLPDYEIHIDFRSTTRPDKNGKVNIPQDTIDKYFCADGGGSKALANAYSVQSRNVKSAERFGQEIRQAYKRKEGYYLLFHALPYLDYRRLRKEPYFNKTRYGNGLIAKERPHRYRPYGETRMASATIGTVYAKTLDSVRIEGHGLRGIEKGFDEYLAGIPGKGYSRKVRRGYSTVVLESPVDGANVHTTIDVEMQEILDYELAQQLLKLNATDGWAAFVEVKTGKIRAVSNLHRDGSTITEDYNHLFSDLGDPGSTFKTVSYMIMLEDGKITPETVVDTKNTAQNPGTFNYHGKQIRDDHPVGVVTAEEGMEQSSNIALAKLTTQAYETDPQHYLDAVNRIGFLDDHVLADSELVMLKTRNILPLTSFKHEFPEAIPARHRRVGDGSWSKMSLGQISYGYENSIPGIFMLQFYNAIANDGCLVRPYIVDHVEKDGKVLFEQEPVVLNKKICSERTLKQVRRALERVVESGTARSEWRKDGTYYREGVKTPKLKIAGKTGTAQRVNPLTGLYSGDGHNVSFAGYFPADDPQYCGIVVINSKGYTGGRPGGGFMAGPVFRHFAERVYSLHCPRSLKDIVPDTLSHAPVMKREFDKADIVRGKMPDVKGMGASDALLALESAGFTNVHINGAGKVVSQTLSGNQVTIVLK